MAHNAEISFVRGKHQTSMMKMDNVVGVGVGYKVHRGKQTDELCLVVLVTKKTAQRCHGSSRPGAEID